jgi:hypothetical protein
MLILIINFKVYIFIKKDKIVKVKVNVFQNKKLAIKNLINVVLIKACQVNNVDNFFIKKLNLKAFILLFIMKMTKISLKI